MPDEEGSKGKIWDKVFYLVLTAIIIAAEALLDKI